MKKQSKLLVIGLVVAFVAVFSVSTASAGWMGDATIENISSSASGDYTVRATDGVNSYAFTIVSTDANAKSMLAIALTAHSSAALVNIQYNSASGIMDRIWVK
jgi:hypothetical protein